MRVASFLRLRYAAACMPRYCLPRPSLRRRTLRLGEHPGHLPGFRGRNWRYDQAVIFAQPGSAARHERRAVFAWSSG